MRYVCFDLKKATQKLKNLAYISIMLGVMLAISFFILVTLFDITDFGISFATIGASTFVIFQNKKNFSLKPLLYAYIIAAIVGFASNYFNQSTAVECVIAFIVTFFILLVLNIKHTPAIAFAVSAVLNHFKLPVLILALIGIFMVFFISNAIKEVVLNPKKFFIEAEKPKLQFNFRKKEIPLYMMVDTKKAQHK